MSFHWHAQNLNERPDGSTGSIWREGRAWFNWRKYSFHPSWSLRSRFCHAYVAVDRDDEPLTIAIAIPPVALWLSFGAPFLRRWIKDDRRCEVSIHDWTLRIDPWARAMEWSSRDPWYVRGVTLDIQRFLLGRDHYSERTLREMPIQIELDGRTYEGTCRMFESEWRRSRWFTRRLLRADVQMKHGIPVPGKGENSWDCGEDAIYGQTSNVRDEREAVASVLESVLSTRQRHGGPNWKPQAVRASES